MQRFTQRERRRREKDRGRGGRELGRERKPER